MTTAKFCAECGTALPSATAKFCAECGTVVGSPAPQQPEREQPQNLATLEDRRAIVAAEVARYQKQGWKLIGIPGIKAEVYKGSAIRRLEAQGTGSLTDTLEERQSSQNTTQVWFIVAAVVGVLVVLGVIVSRTGTKGGNSTTGSSSSGALLSPVAYSSTVESEARTVASASNNLSVLLKSPEPDSLSWNESVRSQLAVFSQVDQEAETTAAARMFGANPTPMA